MFAAVLVLYRNLALLTSVTTENLQMKVLRTTTLFNMGILFAGMMFSLLLALDVYSFSENSEKMFAMMLIFCVMVFFGIVSPKLPFTKHTGLRLPWTVRDEDTWNVAHRIMGMISIPTALLYVACSLTIPDFEMVTGCAMAVWIGIPGVISYIYYYKKFR